MIDLYEAERTENQISFCTEVYSAVQHEISILDNRLAEIEKVKKYPAKEQVVQWYRNKLLALRMDKSLIEDRLFTLINKKHNI